MKKVIYSASIFLSMLVVFGLYFYLPNQVNAQNPTYFSNIGTLKNVVSAGFSFTKDLQIGDTDPDVEMLKAVLNADPDTEIDTTGFNSSLKSGPYFDSLTKTAVIKFQNKYKDIVLTLNGITSADGLINKATRTRLNLLIGVFNTYDSSGLPQKRGGVGSGIVSAPVITTSSAPQMSVCQFIDLLLSVGVVSADKATLARSAMNCSGGITVCQFVNLLISIDAIPSNRVEAARSIAKCNSTLPVPVNNNLVVQPNTQATSSVDLKANNQDSIIISSPQDVTFSWTSTADISSCVLNSNTEEAFGSSVQHIASSGVFKITCSGLHGTVYDYASVIISNTIPLATTTATTTSPVATSTKKVDFGGTVMSTTPCTGSPSRFEIVVVGYPAPGVRVIYEAIKPLPPVGAPILGTADGSTKANEKCAAINPAWSALGLKKAGNLGLFSFDSK
ncbi:MAG: hypothetical protein WCP24_00960 [bacterium]